MRPFITSIDQSKPFGQLVFDYGETKYRDGFFFGVLIGLSTGILLSSIWFLKLRKR
jgi:hypothetical protein